MAKTKRLFGVKVYHNLTDDPRETTIESRNDLTARAKAIPEAIKAFNLSQDQFYKQDKQNWSSGDKPLNSRDYRHITEKDVTFCEIRLLNEWTA